MDHLYLVCVLLVTGRGLPRVADDIERTPMNRCGPIALQSCAVLLGRDTTSREIDSLGIPSDDDGCSLLDLQTAARALRFHVVGVCWGGDPPTGRAPPAVIPITTPIGKRHFVVMVARHEDRILILDVPHSPGWVRRDDLRSKLSWHGEALYIAAADADLDGVRAATSPRRAIAAVGGCCIVGTLLVVAAYLHAVRVRRQGPGLDGTPIA